MDVAGRGRILFWEGASLWIMEALPARGSASNTTDFHAHHAIQITIALGGRFALRTRTNTVSCDAAVAPDQEHLLEAVGLMAVLFVEPESQAGRAICKTLLDGEALAPLPGALIADLIPKLRQACATPQAGERALEDIGRMLVQRLAGGAQAALPDTRVRAIIDYASSHLDRPVTLSAVARHAGLSESRARHLFVEQTGLPFRTYMLWLRITKAVGLFSAGNSLTEAAHEAGFADSAHFSRTFRRMFGIAAASLRIT